MHPKYANACFIGCVWCTNHVLRASLCPYRSLNLFSRLLSLRMSTSLSMLIFLAKRNFCRRAPFTVRLRLLILYVDISWSSPFLRAFASCFVDTESLLTHRSLNRKRTPATSISVF